MEIKMSSSAGGFDRPRIAPGFYRATFVGAEEVKEGKYGARLAWKFEILPVSMNFEEDKKKYDRGVILSRVTYATITPISMAGSIVTALGVTISDGNLDVDKLKGKECQIFVDDYTADIEGKKVTVSSIDKVKALQK